MTYDEFCVLLSGLMNKTPLGQTIEIRSETDKDRLKHFNQEQHAIRNEWNRKHALKQQRYFNSLSAEEKSKLTNDLQNIFKQIAT